MKPGTEIDGFVLQTELGSGANGTVWAVEHASTQAPYALKLIDLGGSPKERERFRREVEALTRVDGHPNLVRVHTAGVWRRRPYVVMEQLVGGDLRTRLRHGPLPPREAARLVESLARGLAHAHAQGVLHRDIKPANVLFDAAGVAKLADFGLAGSADTHSLTQTGQLLGTPAYMPPEQVTGNVDRIDQRSDVYALGAVLFEVLTGEVPFPARDLTHLAVQIVNAKPAPLRELTSGIPPALERICLRALSKDSADRQPSATALADELAAYEDEAEEERAAWEKAGVVGALGLVAVGGLLAFGLSSGPASTASTASTSTSTPSASPRATGVTPAPTARPSQPPVRSPAPKPTSTPPAHPGRDRVMAILTDPKELQRRAAEGDLAANRHLGQLADKRRDYRAALRHFMVLARAGERDAIVNVAGILLSGRPGVPADPARGLEWCRKAAEAGHEQSIERMIRAYFGVYGLPRNLARARKWLERLIELGTPSAKAEAAKFILERPRHLGGTKRAIALLEEARQGGSSDAYYVLGKRALRDNDPARGRRLLREAGKRGSRRAVGRLAQHLLGSNPSAAERAEALQLLRISATRHDSVESMLILGSLLRRSGVAADRKEARRHLEVAARKGSRRAREILAERW